MGKPILSVVTIVYNNVRDIAYTLRSVTQQTYPHIQYIVVDGLSNDGTMEVIQGFADKIDILISEKDKGIYDAMNKGLKQATGDYIIFINSGDEFMDDNTVANVFSCAEDADIYYGETKLIAEDRTILGDRRHKTPAAFTWRSFSRGMNICHQAIYIKRSLAPTYDTQYQLSADIDWVIKSAKKAKKIVNTQQYVARYLVGGMSQKRHRQSLKERYEIFKKHYGLIPNFFNHLFIGLRLVFQRLKNGKTQD